jgi:hypothetical protein
VTVVPACLPAYLPTCLPGCLAARLPVCPPADLPAWLPVCLLCKRSKHIIFPPLFLNIEAVLVRRTNVEDLILRTITWIPGNDLPNRVRGANRQY